MNARDLLRREYGSDIAAFSFYCGERTGMSAKIACIESIARKIWHSAQAAMASCNCGASPGASAGGSSKRCMGNGFCRSSPMDEKSAL